MDLERTLAEIEEAVAKATPGPWYYTASAQEGDAGHVIRPSLYGKPLMACHDGRREDSPDFLLVIALRNHAPLLIAALKWATRRRVVSDLASREDLDPAAVVDAMKVEIEAQAEFDALAEGE